MQSCLAEHNAFRLGKQAGGDYGSIVQAVCGSVPAQAHLCSLDKQRLSLAAKAALQDTWALIGPRSMRTPSHRQCYQGPILRQEEHIQKMWAAVEGLENQASRTTAICNYTLTKIYLTTTLVGVPARTLVLHWQSVFDNIYILSTATTFPQVHSDHKELFQVSRYAKEQGFDLSSEPV